MYSSIKGASITINSSLGSKAELSIYAMSGFSAETPEIKVISVVTRTPTRFPERSRNIPTAAQTMNFFAESDVFSPVYAGSFRVTARPVGMATRYRGANVQRKSAH